MPGPSTPVRGVAPLGGSDMAARVDAVEEVRERFDARPTHRVSFQVGQGEDAARVNLNLRGDQLRAEIGSRNDRLEARLQRELPELVRTLRARGVDPETLVVRRDGIVAAETTTVRPGQDTRSGNQTAGGGHEPGGHRPDRERHPGRDNQEKQES